jgi:CheY-like chemotaxis protein
MARVALVVDDSMLIRHTVCRFLEERGYVVESAANGLEALEMLDRVKPELIATDLQMPKMGGIELIAVLRARPASARIPIVVLTATRGGQRPEDQAFPHVVCKDIDIEAELARVLEQFSTTEVVPS